jgi:hypothetical protein
MDKKGFLRTTVLTKIIVGTFFVWFMPSTEAWETIKAKRAISFL